MTTKLYGELDDQILSGNFHQATDAFCRLAREGEAITDLVTHVMNTAAPYLQVPSHEKLLPNGEFRNVNYDHTILGLRAGMRLSPNLPEAEKHLGIVQGMYYVPQGLDVWAQLECGFPGHYSREQEKCTEFGNELHSCFDEQEPLVEGSLDDRFDGMLQALMQGDKVTSYRLFLGLADEPEQRQRLRNTLHFASIVDQQEYNSFRRVRHIGHKAIRTRAMFDLADWTGWDKARPFFYVGVPDVCNAPIFHSLYDHVSVVLGTTFKGAQDTLVETNTDLMSEEEQDRFIGLMLEGDPVAVATEITELLKKGRAPQSIADTVMIGNATHCVTKLRAPIGYTVPTHSFDYANVVTYWLRNYRHPHQAKAVYLAAWFATDTIHEVDFYPDFPGVVKPNPEACQGWADGIAAANLLGELEKAVAAQDASSAVALVRSYQARVSDREDLIRTLAHCAGKYQGDAHIFRNATSVIEEYRLNTASAQRKEILFQFWAHYLSFYMKRTLATDCYDMYHRYLA